MRCSLESWFTLVEESINMKCTLSYFIYVPYTMKYYKRLIQEISFFFANWIFYTLLHFLFVGLFFTQLYIYSYTLHLNLTRKGWFIKCTVYSIYVQFPVYSCHVHCTVFMFSFRCTVAMHTVQYLCSVSGVQLTWNALYPTYNGITRWTMVQCGF